MYTFFPHILRVGHYSESEFQSICNTSVLNKVACRIDSVKALRYQLPEICEELDELAEEASNVVI
jgi:hypothetical protein